MRNIDKRIDDIEDFCKEWWKVDWVTYIGPDAPHIPGYPYVESLCLRLEKAEEFVEFLKRSFESRVDYKIILEFRGYLDDGAFKGYIATQTPEALQLCRLSLCQ